MGKYYTYIWKYSHTYWSRIINLIEGIDQLKYVFTRTNKEHIWVSNLQFLGDSFNNCFRRHVCCFTRRSRSKRGKNPIISLITIHPFHMVESYGLLLSCKQILPPESTCQYSSLVIFIIFHKVEKKINLSEHIFHSKINFQTNLWRNFHVFMDLKKIINCCGN